MLFRFELVSDSKEGTVFPPLMTITYSDIPITDVARQTVSVSQANTHTRAHTHLSVRPLSDWWTEHQRNHNIVRFPIYTMSFKTFI